MIHKLILEYEAVNSQRREKVQNRLRKEVKGTLIEMFMSFHHCSAILMIQKYIL